MEGGIVEERATEGKKVGGRRLHNALSERTVRATKTPGRYFDGQGLFLMVQPSGAKSWVQRVTVRGRRQELGLGGYPVVTLQMAREAALTNRREIRKGQNPKANRQRARGVPTFAEAARKVYELRRPGWRSAKHARQWIGTLEEFVFPRFADHGVDDISTEDVIAVLSPIWHARPTTAKRVRQRIAKDYAALLAFAVKMRRFGPYNAMLLHRQRPGLSFAASAPQWRAEWKRAVKEDARPLVVLRRFGPVGFVYDIQDTEALPDAPELPRSVFSFPAAGDVSEAISVPASVMPMFLALSAETSRCRHGGCAGTSPTGFAIGARRPPVISW